MIRMRWTAKGVGGWDAECPCGWKSNTGGAIRASVQRDVDWHKAYVHGILPAVLRRTMGSYDEGMSAGQAAAREALERAVG